MVPFADLLCGSIDNGKDSLNQVFEFQIFITKGLFYVFSNVNLLDKLYEKSIILLIFIYFLYHQYQS